MTVAGVFGVERRAPDPLKRTLRRVFRVNGFRPGQEDVVRSVLNGRDTAAITANYFLYYVLYNVLIAGPTSAGRKSAAKR